MSFIIIKRDNGKTFWIDENGFYGTENITEIEKTRKKLEIIGKIAVKKFEKIKEDIPDDDNDNLLEPHLWMHNQDYMRKLWENFKNDCDTEIGKILLNNNSFVEYNQFMYDNYPANYTKNAQHNRKTGLYIDFAEIYLILKKIQVKSCN
jgi:hypothetical protein